MLQRGRKSAASLAVVQSPLETIQRQLAPGELNDEEVEVWSAVVNDQAADWFSPSTVPVLAAYCRHTIAARRVAEYIEKATSDPDLSISDYDRLLKMQERESRAIASLATKMRMTQQSTRTDRGNKKPTPARTSAGSSLASSAAKRAIFSFRERVAATSPEVATTSASLSITRSCGSGLGRAQDRAF